MPRRKDLPTHCTQPGCDRVYAAKGYCQAHWARARRGMPMDAPLRLVGLSKRRDEHGRKQCSACREWLEPTEFHPKRGVSDGLQAKCRPCLLKYNRATKYGLTPELVDKMFEAQGGKCAICFEALQDDCHIDHDHNCCSGYRSCGKCVRGLLCNSCNLMLGMVKDSASRLRSAVAYLERSTAD